MARRKTSSLATTAGDLGKALGEVAARLDAWKKQRAAIAADIHKVLHSARRMLGELGDATAGGASAVLVTAPKGKGGRPKGYKMSEETKRKLRAAWKRRKAAAKDAATS